MSELSLTRHNSLCTGRFRAMASPCEIILDHDDFAIAAQQVNAAAYVSSWCRLNHLIEP